MSIGLPKTYEKKINNWCRHNNVSVACPMEVKEKLYWSKKPKVIVPSEKDILRMVKRTKKEQYKSKVWKVNS